MRLARFIAPLAALVLVFTAANPAGAGLQPGSAGQMKAAALETVAILAPNVPIVRVQIARVVGEWAAVRVSPPAGVTDPALVLLRRVDGAWISVAGPGTGFPPGNRAGAPDDLFDYGIPYSGDAGQAAIDRLAAPPLTYRGAGISFRYPADATVEAIDGDLLIAGPATGVPTFPGPAYEIRIQVSAGRLAVPLDEYAYDRAVAESDGPGGPGTLLRSFTTYGADENAVAQIDIFGGDSTLRTLIVQPPEGASVIEIRTRVYPIENNPAAPQAESAVALILQTMNTER